MQTNNCCQHVCLSAQTLCIQVKIRPIGHFGCHVTHTFTLNHETKQTNIEKNEKKEEYQHTTKPTKQKTCTRTTREKEWNQKSKTKKSRFVVEIVHIWKERRWKKKRHEHWIEEAQSYILETRYSINKPNLEYEANNEKLTENTERKKNSFREKNYNWIKSNG